MIPIYEEVGTAESKEAAEAEEEEAPETATPLLPVDAPNEQGGELAPGRRSTRHLIERAVARLTRAGGRKTEGDAPHLLEAIAVIVYDPDSAALDPDLPQPGSRLRWEEFIDDLVAAYLGRFED